MGGIVGSSCGQAPMRFATDLGALSERGLGGNNKGMVTIVSTPSSKACGSFAPEFEAASLRRVFWFPPSFLKKDNLKKKNKLECALRSSLGQHLAAEAMWSNGDGTPLKSLVDYTGAVIFAGYHWYNQDAIATIKPSTRKPWWCRGM